MARAVKRLDPHPDIVLERLALRYGFPRHGNPRDPFFCSVYVLLSAQTTLEQATAAIREVRKRWPTATALSAASASELRGVINSCGFGSQRTPKILALAAAVSARTERLSSLRHLSDFELEAELTALPGIGFKTARVVAAMSSFDRDRFAIDTHTWRIANRLGWTSRVRLDRKPTLRQADSLERRIPIASRRQLHSCLVALGRDCCRPKATACGRCVLADICRRGRQQVPSQRSSRERT